MAYEKYLKEMSIFALKKNTILVAFQIFKTDFYKDTEGRVKTRRYNSEFNIQNKLLFLYCFSLKQLN